MNAPDMSHPHVQPARIPNRVGLLAGGEMTGGGLRFVAPLRRTELLHRPYERHR